MTVKDLIEKLSQFDQDTRVLIADARIDNLDFSMNILDAEYTSRGGRVVTLIVKET